MEAVEFLLKNGADVNTSDNRGFTLLMFCVELNNIDLLNTILSYPVMLNKRDKKGFNALDYAIKSDNLDIVKLLIESGADITDENYMHSINTNTREITRYFDSFDINKQIFLKNGQ
ncbi:MAG: ankyrin repeat domain-containing protein [Campylobacterota bacterium]|nr:ankyrin repeat domain-containing protein [Campylobacterota bacterium]